MTLFSLAEKEVYGHGRKEGSYPNDLQRAFAGIPEEDHTHHHDDERHSDSDVRVPQALSLHRFLSDNKISDNIMHYRIDEDGACADRATQIAGVSAFLSKALLGHLASTPNRPTPNPPSTIPAPTAVASTSIAIVNGPT